MIISLWVHGIAGNADVPCGEIDVFDVSGEKITIDEFNSWACKFRYQKPVAKTSES